jgi:hypothetical protein
MTNRIKNYLLVKFNYEQVRRMRIHAGYILLLANIAILGNLYLEYQNLEQQLATLSVSVLPAQAEGAESSPAPSVGSKEWVKKRWEDAGAKWEDVYAVVQIESGWNANAFNCNTNRTVDLSWYQLNSVHLKRCGDLKCLADPVCSTDCAIDIWKEQGWTPWVGAKKLGIK